MSYQSFQKLRVDVFLSGSVDQEKNGGWCAHLHSHINGRSYEKTLAGFGVDTTPTRMSLKALVETLKTIKNPVFLHIYTTSVQISTGIHKNLKNWELNDFHTKTGQPVKHNDLWRQIHELLPEKTLGYKVHLQNQTNTPDPYRLKAVHTSSQYALKAKQVIYEVTL